MARNKGRVTLIHNDTAGDARHSREELVALLEGAGYAVTCLRYKRDDWQKALDRPADLVVAAGGDGTVAKIAARVRPAGPPLAILPLGTANNLAKALGFDRPFEELVMGWSARRTRPFHLIEATGRGDAAALPKGSVSPRSNRRSRTCRKRWRPSTPADLWPTR